MLLLDIPAENSLRSLAQVKGKRGKDLELAVSL
jgi:hypothetical protein